MIRKLLVRLHLYVGLSLGLLLVSAGLTGSLLVWRAELDALLHPELLRVRPLATRLPLQQALDAVRAAYPDRPPAQLRLPRRADESVQVTTGGADPLQVYVDPYRAVVLGARRPHETFANALFEWHRSLLSGKTGERVMGAAALSLLLLVATGLVAWWPGLRRLGDALRVKWRANWKRVNFDLHRAGGFWTAVFLTAASVTGASLVFKEAFATGLDGVTRSAPRPVAPRIELDPARASLPADALIRAANAVVPEGQVIYLTLPGRPDAPAVVRKRVPGELHPNGRTFAYLHPQTGRVLELEHALRAPAGTRAYNSLYPVHIGHWGGTASRVLYSLLGLAPLLLFVSGVLMWRNRTRGAGKRRGARATPGRAPRVRRPPTAAGQPR